MVSIFISHSSKDKFIARKLAEKLIKNDVTVWIDEAELRIGDSLIKKISEAVNKSEYIAIILTHNSVQSPWVQKELEMAMTQEIDGKTIKVLPLLFENCALPAFLEDKLYADFTDPDDFNTPFLRLLRSIGVSKPISEVPDAPIASEEPAIEHEVVLEEFEDITMVGINKDKLYRPDSDKLLYNVYFELSAVPTSEWVDIFDGERHFPRHTMWRRAWIEDNYAVVHCCLDEVKAYHLRDLKEDIATSNRKYREYLHQSALEKIKEQNREGEERAEIDDALDGIDF